MSAKPNLKLVNLSEAPKRETSESLPEKLAPTEKVAIGPFTEDPRLKVLQQEAAAKMGTRYLCHPDNRVQKLKKRTKRLSILDQWKRTR